MYERILVSLDESNTVEMVLPYAGGLAALKQKKLVSPLTKVRRR